jgi:hypothetical protein
LATYTPTNIENYSRRNGLKMKRRTKLGLILLAGLTLVWAHQPEATMVKLPKDLVIVSNKATWEEKRENKRLAKKYAWAAFGWRDREWKCLHDLWMREAKFDHLATNQQGSSAFGIAQLLGEKSPDPRLQILRGLKYIRERYSTPCRANSFSLRKGYY